MPASTAPDDEIRAIVALLKRLAAPRDADGGTPVAEPPPGVTLVIRDGRSIRGERRNEDAFSIQIAEKQRTAARLQQVGHPGDRPRRVAARARSPTKLADASPGSHTATFSTASRIRRSWLTYSGDYSGTPPQSADRRSRRERSAACSPNGRFQTGTMTRGRGFEVDAARSSTACSTSPVRTISPGRSTRAPAGRSGNTAASCRPISPTARRRRSIAASASSAIGCS